MAALHGMALEGKSFYFSITPFVHRDALNKSN